MFRILNIVLEQLLLPSPLISSDRSNDYLCNTKSS